MATNKAGYPLLLIDPSSDESSSDSEELSENFVKNTTMKTNDQSRQKGDNTDDLLSDRHFRDTSRYVDLQLDLEEFYSSMQEFVMSEEFRKHIKKDGYDLDKIEEKLRFGKNDVLKTECPVVITGEASAGKSSLINLLLCEQILPTAITASTSRVCRIKYCERCVVSTKDCMEKELENMSFKNIEEMTDKLKSLAETDIAEICYVDIYIPVPFLQGNVMIVDTPGCGDLEQKKVADMMMSYLPNALAFIFVVNVSNAGGIQDDRLLKIITELRNSLDEMVSFNPKDVIFLLNKWDTISHVSKENREKYFEEAKQVIRKSWKEVDDSCIFHTSAVKVLKKKEKYTEVFDKFRKVLRDVIARNEYKRVKVHLKYLNGFLHEFNRVLSTKLRCAKENAEDNETKLEELSRELEELEKNRQEELFNIERRIDTFLNEATNHLHEYIHHPDFREEILKESDTFTRFSIRQELNSRIEKNILDWQKKHLDDIFQKIIMGHLLKKFENIHRSLHSIKDILKGFQTPFEVESKIVEVINSAITSGKRGIALLQFCINVITYSFDPKVPFSITTAAMMVLRLFTFDAVPVDGFTTTRQNAFQSTVNVLTKEKIKGFLSENYSEGIHKIIRAYLEGNLKKEMNKIKENISTMRNDHAAFISEKDTLFSMQKTVIQKIESLEQIGCIDLVNE